MLAGSPARGEPIEQVEAVGDSVPNHSDAGWKSLVKW